jgi:hypothetical protein
MNLLISENTELRTVETLINEAKALGLRVVHRPDTAKSNVFMLDDARKEFNDNDPKAA